MGFISDIAASLKFCRCISPWTVDIFVCGTCHDNLGASGCQKIPERKSDGEGDILLINILFAKVSDSTGICSAMSRVKTNNFTFQDVFRFVRDIIRLGRRSSHSRC